MLSVNLVEDRKENLMTHPLVTKAPDKVLREFCRKTGCPIVNKIDEFEKDNPGKSDLKARSWCYDTCLAHRFNDYINTANLTVTKNSKRDRYT